MELKRANSPEMQLVVQPSYDNTSPCCCMLESYSTQHLCLHYRYWWCRFCESGCHHGCGGCAFHLSRCCERLFRTRTYDTVVISAGVVCLEAPITILISFSFYSTIQFVNHVRRTREAHPTKTLTRVCAFQHSGQLWVAHTGLLPSGADRPRSNPDLRVMKKLQEK